MPPALPPCGVYRLTANVAGLEAGRLVYFHNHGDPGPGMYLPETWVANRAKWSERGTTVPADFDPKVLHELKPEGFYRVTREFYCCEKKCTKFETDTFVQLGYNGNATPLVFMPQVGANGISIPDRGSVVDEKVLSNLQPMKMAQAQGTEAEKPEINISLPRGFVVH